MAQSDFAAPAKSFQSCPTRCDPIDGSPSGSPVPGILQARRSEEHTSELQEPGTGEAAYISEASERAHQNQQEKYLSLQCSISTFY